jgi:hypothetical protein
MPVPEHSMSLRSPHHWKYAPEREVNYQSHETQWRGLWQTEPYFNWLGVMPRAKVDLRSLVH